MKIEPGTIFNCHFFIPYIKLVKTDMIALILVMNEADINVCMKDGQSFSWSLL